MNTHNFIKQSLQRGIRFSVNGGKLDVEAPEDALTPDVVEYMKQHKPEIIEVLSDQQHGDCVHCGDDTDAMLTVPGTGCMWCCPACFEKRAGAVQGMAA